MQDNDLTVDGAMTAPKGDRSKAPHEQADPDMYVHVGERRPDGIVVCVAKCHQTGSSNSHWHIFMPTIAINRRVKGSMSIDCLSLDDAHEYHECCLLYTSRCV